VCVLIICSKCGWGSGRLHAPLTGKRPPIVRGHYMGSTCVRSTVHKLGVIGPTQVVPSGLLEMYLVGDRSFFLNFIESSSAALITYQLLIEQVTARSLSCKSKSIPSPQPRVHVIKNNTHSPNTFIMCRLSNRVSICNRIALYSTKLREFSAPRHRLRWHSSCKLRHHETIAWYCDLHIAQVTAWSVHLRTDWVLPSGECHWLAVFHSSSRKHSEMCRMCPIRSRILNYILFTISTRLLYLFLNLKRNIRRANGLKQIALPLTAVFYCNVGQCLSE